MNVEIIDEWVKMTPTQQHQIKEFYESTKLAKHLPTVESLLEEVERIKKKESKLPSRVRSHALKTYELFFVRKANIGGGTPVSQAALITDAMMKVVL
jgi:hypothetical protein